MGDSPLDPKIQEFRVIFKKMLVGKRYLKYIIIQVKKGRVRE
jgi:hypothetical protein